MKNEILIRTLNENHVIVIHVTHVISINSLDETEVDQKIIFSSKNVIIIKKIIFVLNAAIQIIQLKIANTYSIQIRYL